MKITDILIKVEFESKPIFRTIKSVSRARELPLNWTETYEENVLMFLFFFPLNQSVSRAREEKLRRARFIFGLPVKSKLTALPLSWTETSGDNLLMHCDHWIQREASFLFQTKLFMIQISKWNWTIVKNQLPFHYLK